MLTTVLMCQQGTPFAYSPARDQMVDELRLRGSEVILFFPGIVSDENLKKRLKKIFDTRTMSPSSVRKKIKEINPDIVFAFTEGDARICFPLPYTMRNTDFYYYNLEIYVYPMLYVQNEKGSMVRKITNRIDYLKNKLKEIIYVKGCRALVIQDKLRKKILRKYGISHPVTWLIPNTYCVDFRRTDIPHKSGLIYSGGVWINTMKSFVERAEDIKDVEITISGRTHIKGKFKNNPNIHVITQQLSQEEYTRFISAYDIALIWYTKHDDNLYYMGLSSGKLFKHLSLGQPVIVNNMPGLAEEVRKYKLGVVIEDVSELKDAVRTISSNYDFYVENIKRIYKKRYDYKKITKKFFDTVISDAKTKQVAR